MRPGVRTVTIVGVGPRLPLLMYMGTDQQLAFRPPWGTNQISDNARRPRMIKEPISPNNCIKSPRYQCLHLRRKIRENMLRLDRWLYI